MKSGTAHAGWLQPWPRALPPLRLALRFISPSVLPLWLLTQTPLQTVETAGNPGWSLPPLRDVTLLTKLTTKKTANDPETASDTGCDRERRMFPLPVRYVGQKRTDSLRATARGGRMTACVLPFLSYVFCHVIGFEGNTNIKKSKALERLHAQLL